MPTAHWLSPILRKLPNTTASAYPKRRGKISASIRKLGASRLPKKPRPPVSARASGGLRRAKRRRRARNGDKGPGAFLSESYVSASELCRCIPTPRDRDGLCRSAGKPGCAARRRNDPAAKPESLAGSQLVRRAGHDQRPRKGDHHFTAVYDDRHSILPNAQRTGAASQ